MRSLCRRRCLSKPRAAQTLGDGEAWRRCLSRPRAHEDRLSAGDLQEAQRLPAVGPSLAGVVVVRGPVLDAARLSAGVVVVVRGSSCLGSRCIPPGTKPRSTPCPPCLQDPGAAPAVTRSSRNTSSTSLRGAGPPPGESARAWTRSSGATQPCWIVSWRLPEGAAGPTCSLPGHAASSPPGGKAGWRTASGTATRGRTRRQESRSRPPTVRRLLQEMQGERRAPPSHRRSAEPRALLQGWQLKTRRRSCHLNQRQTHPLRKKRRGLTRSTSWERRSASRSRQRRRHRWKEAPAKFEEHESVEREQSRAGCAPTESPEPPAHQWQ